ncbi:MEMO1 family protein [bacterium]|nr:MEMO1 family protein [bacterium]
MAIRYPAVAGTFYPKSEKALRAQVESFLDFTASKEEVLGIVSPHAGYIYSGGTAGEVFSKINLASTYIILGPNHSGLGQEYAVDSKETWQTPLGDVLIDKDLANSLLNNSTLLKEDNLAHIQEHSIEIQLPFLQCLHNEPFMIIPICIGGRDLEELKQLGKEIAWIVKDSPKKVVIIASSDMTHYESQNIVSKKDSKAIEAILDLNEDELMEKIKKYNISMCGYAPTVIMLKATKELGAKKAILVKYTTSAEASGDYNHVVGYAGIMVK